MILSKLARVQLALFTVMAVVATWVMLFSYMQVQTQLNIGRISVTLSTSGAGGLYEFANVTYRGVVVGKVTDVSLTDDGVQATLSIDDDQRIPADLQASIRSMSAMGEQYVELRPRTDAAPYLGDGSVIDSRDVDLPAPVAPMLEKLNALVTSIPKDQLFSLVDELNRSLGGNGDDLQSLLDSSSTLATGLRDVGTDSRTMLEGAKPLVDSQVETVDAIRMWTRNLEGFTDQVVTNTPEIKTLLASGPDFADEVTALLDSVKLTLPVLLANVTTVGQLAVTYNPGLEQVLVLLPPAISMIQAVQPNRNGTQWGLGDFRISGVSDPPACTVGFLPPDQWRPPEDTSMIDTPNDLYCKLPQDSPIGVRGVRNTPCMNQPGKRAPTAAMCNSEEEFAPLSNDQPVVGPYPRDPNLEQQGITPSSGSGDESVGQPTIGAAQYNPQDGGYVGADGTHYRQAELTTTGRATSWEAMLPR
ncbi:MlaD family protein [Rhodococcus sp. NPDC058521]|uniref:MlaD family protein n=1 Tax=Rhodococcus sp. NPDC058521 TaxID=3346536 RepID=UPI0036593D89